MEKTFYEKTTKTLADKTRPLLGKINLEWSPNLKQAIEFNRMQVTPYDVTAAAWTLGAASMIVSSITAIAAFIYLGVNPLVILLIGAVISLLTLYYMSEYPRIKASRKRIKALGRAPEIIAYLIIPLKQNPNLEEAVRFAAEHSEGDLALDLKKTLWDVWSGKTPSIGEALPSLGVKWGQNVGGLKDAMYSIRISQVEKTESKRINTLDRALDSVINGIQESFKEFVEYLRLPTMVLFAGGAILPLVVVIMLPVASFMGSDLGNPLNLLILLASIVAFMFLYSEYTLSKRPASFPVLDIPDEHPKLPKPGMMLVWGKNISIKKTSLWACFLICSLSLPYLLGLNLQPINHLSTLPLVVGIGVGVFIYLWGKSSCRKKIREEIRETEKQMLEACFQLGNRLLSGISAEEGMIKVALLSDKSKNGAQQIYRNAVQNIRYFNTDLEDAFFDEKKGALRQTHSSMINTLARILVNSMKKSINSASESLITAADHIREIHKMEVRLKNKISYTSSMMKYTAILISPAICALSIYIARVFQKTTEITSSIHESGLQAFMVSGSSTSAEILQLIVGYYMLSLLVILVRYTTILEHGDDPVLVQYELSKSIPIALVVYLGVLASTSILM
ncbi:MAG: hypothetical protein B6U97_04165 [Candidatus Altiarchaeales archaeon ex4484_96]|nr:MAG: hypothetical protein B6U97_04165 [Candidatus Altiarchaeales archaeon ex4484_96]